MSLEKDRRNVYGEAPHGARKNIPLRKKLRNRANRQLLESGLPTGPVPVDACSGDEIETAVLGKAPVVWKKMPDAPLREVIERQQKRRITPPKVRNEVFIVGPNSDLKKLKGERD